MTPGAGNNIRPNRHQLACIKYENATKIDECLVVLKFPSVGTGTPPGGPQFPLAGTGTPWRGLPLCYGGLLKDCKFKHENP